MAVGQNVLKSDHNQVHWGCCSRIPKQTKFFPKGEAHSTASRRHTRFPPKRNNHHGYQSRRNTGPLYLIWTGHHKNQCWKRIDCTFRAALSFSTLMPTLMGAEQSLLLVSFYYSKLECACNTHRNVIDWVTSFYISQRHYSWQDLVYGFDEWSTHFSFFGTALSHNL